GAGCRSAGRTSDKSCEFPRQHSVGRPDRKSPILTGNLAAGSAFQRRECPKGRLAPRSSNRWGSGVGLSWQQGPLSTGAIGRFLVPEPLPERLLPERLLYVEPLRRRMRVRFGGT